MPVKVVAVFALLLSCLSLAAQDRFRENEHYRVIPTTFETADATSDTVVVTEMFSYSCIHCYNLEDELHAWVERQDSHVKFEREHVVFSPAGLSLAKAFYTAEELGITDKIHDALFAAIHINRLRMNEEDLLVRLFEGRGEVEAGKFKEVFDGFNVSNRIRKSDTLVRAWRIEGTPALVVDSRYVAAGPAIRSRSHMFEVVDFLVEKVLNDRKQDLSG